RRRLELPVAQRFRIARSFRFFAEREERKSGSQLLFSVSLPRDHRLGAQPSRKPSQPHAATDRHREGFRARLEVADRFWARILRSGPRPGDKDGHRSLAARGAVRKSHPELGAVGEKLSRLVFESGEAALSPEGRPAFQAPSDDGKNQARLFDVT